MNLLFKILQKPMKISFPTLINIPYWKFWTFLIITLFSPRKYNPFIYNNKTHDIPFAENCNEILHQHYNNEGIFLTQDIEYNDSCASQFVLTAV